jgi:hypothetical protein
VTDFGKFAVIGAIMGALLLVGLLLQPAKIEEPVVPAATAATAEVTVLETKSLELLDPIYSEKAVFQDGTIRVSFDVSQDTTGVESRLSFWLHNTSGSVINVLWDRCSIMLPEGNTVSVLSEEGLKYGTGTALSIAPAGDLFDAMIPMSELAWTESGYDVSSSVLDQGIFTVVLAVERGKAMPEGGCMHQAMAVDACGQPAAAQPMPMSMCPMGCGDGREVVYYTFRFVIR